MSALRSYRLLIVWQARRLKGFLPLAIVVQALFALGIVVGYPMLFPQMDRLTILFLATGAPTITLITMGVVAVPQLVAQAKTEGTLDYLRALPAPRLAYLFADLTVWLAWCCRASCSPSWWGRSASTWTWRSRRSSCRPCSWSR